MREVIYLVRLFTPPGRVERRGEHPLFGRLKFTRGVSLLKEAGLYRQVEEPTPEQIGAAEAAYLGGYKYVVEDDEGDALTTAGYGEWVEPYGYGDDIYGEGFYGLDDFGE